MKISKKLLNKIIREELEEMKASSFYSPWESPLPPMEAEQEACDPKTILLKARSEMNAKELGMLINRLSMILKGKMGSLEEGCGCPHGCPGGHGEILVAYDPTGKEVMRSKAFRDDEADQLTALVPVLQAQGLAVEIIPAPHEHPIAVSVMDAPEEKIH